MQIYVNAIRDAFSSAHERQPRSCGRSSCCRSIVSGSAICIATLIGVPLGYLLGMSRFAGRGILILLVNTAMGFPPVVIGLFVYMALSRSGPLGLLAFAVHAAGHDHRAGDPGDAAGHRRLGGRGRERPARPRLQLRALGASRLQEGLEVLKEARGGVMVSIVAGFGAIISEVGAVSIVGGGIEGYTDVMTTAIMANVRRGEFPQAMAWAMVLMGIALIVNVALTTIQNAGQSYER